MLSVYWEGHLIFFGPITKNSDQNNKKNLDDPEVDAFFSLDDVVLTKKIRRCGAQSFRRSGGGEKNRRCGGKVVLDDPELTKLDDTA